MNDNDDEEEETIESLTETLEGVLHVLEAHAMLLARILRTLHDLGLRFDDVPANDTKH